MKIYLLEQNINTGYGTYNSVVVIAKNKKEARKIHPSSYVTHITDNEWMGTRYWEQTEDEYEYCLHDWVGASQIDKIKVTHIGTATEEQKKGVLLASFNAG